MRISDWSSDVCSSDLMTGLPMVENRLPRAAAEGQDRHVAAKGERPSLDPQRLARLDRRDLVPTDVQRRMKQAKEDGRAKVDSALVDPDIDRIPVADPARKTADRKSTRLNSSH